MNEIKHHLTDKILLGYAAGTLPEAFSLVVATHISMCDECRARLGAFDAIGGTLLESSDDLMDGNMPAVDFDATLERIEAGSGDEEAEKSAPIEAPESASTLPVALQNYIGGDLDAVKWRPVGMGVRQAILKTSRSASVRLLHIPAGTAVPDHGHHGTEMTIVLQGAFRDEFDRFGPGDVEIATEDLEHTPVAEEGVDCICLAATDAPLKFNGLLQRIAQPFLKI
ncbi:MAG: transcriptional regulator [Litoreibacter sp.]|nr:transcriptional regulator [Litoreibacter sp.]